MAATSRSSKYFRCRSTILPSLARTHDSRSPSANRASLTMARGILTARLFPHVATRVLLGISIYNEYTAQIWIRVRSLPLNNWRSTDGASRISAFR